MDWMPLGNSCLIPHPPKIHPYLHLTTTIGGDDCRDGNHSPDRSPPSSLSPSSNLYKTCPIQHGRRGMRRRRHNGADRLLHVSYTSVAEREWST